MLTYVTTNEGKLREAEQYLGELTDLDRAAYDYVEVQADDLETVAARGAADAYREVGGPVLVDDAGLFVDALSGFPGPYSSYVEERLGIERVRRLVAPEDDHRAAFRCVLAYAEGPDGPVGSGAGADGGGDTAPDGGGDTASDGGGDTAPDGGGDTASDGGAARGATDDAADDAGEPALVETFAGSVQGRIVEPRGDGGFGYDPIFEHGGRTLAEMETAEKNAISHRGRALAAFADWYAERTA